MSKFQECANNGNAMTNTFDWAGLTEEIVKVHFAKYPLDLLHLLRTRIEAAFVPVDHHAGVISDHDELLQCEIARAEAAEAIADDVHKALWAAEARVKVLEEALREALNLAEGLHDSHDYLGTGRNSRIAYKEHAEDAAKIKRIAQALGAEQ